MVAKATASSSRRVRDMVAAALIAALMAATGWVSIPLGTVPVTLQTMCVALAALLLPAGWAAASMALYVVLGAVGVPVFAGGEAGLGVVLGPTGGYLVGFVAAAGIASFVRESTHRAKAPQLLADIMAGIILLAVIYIIGTAWLAYSLHLSLAKAVLAGVVPFVLGDAAKVGVAIMLATAIRKAGVRL
jgi:biotin transport system substrate-specific component